MDQGVLKNQDLDNRFFRSLESGQESSEYMCQENNRASKLMIGSEGSVDRVSQIVP